MLQIRKYILLVTIVYKLTADTMADVVKTVKSV